VTRNRGRLCSTTILVLGAVLLAVHAPARAGAAAGSPLKAALLVSGPVDDQSWNQIGYQGLLRIAGDLGAAVAYRQVGSAAERVEGLREYGRQGFDLVIGHGEEYAGPVAQVGPEFPGTIFVTTGGDTVLPNAAPIRLAMEEATYLLGILAAGVSRTGQAGLIGGEPLAQIQRTFDAFTAGARSVNPSFRVSTVFLGSWTDVAEARAQALERLREGADILLPNADAANAGVFQAAQEANAGYRVTAFGMNGNQNAMAPEVILASAVLDVPAAFVQVAREVTEGRFVAAVHRLGMRDGAVALIFNPHLESRVSADLRRKVEEAKERILAGTLDPLAGP